MIKDTAEAWNSAVSSVFSAVCKSRLLQKWKHTGVIHARGLTTPLRYGIIYKKAGGIL